MTWVAVAGAFGVLEATGVLDVADATGTAGVELAGDAAAGKALEVKDSADGCDEGAVEPLAAAEAMVLMADSDDKDEFVFGESVPEPPPQEANSSVARVAEKAARNERRRIDKFSMKVSLSD